MPVYRYLKSVYRNDNQEQLVNLLEWGHLTLSGAELEQFESDCYEISQYLSEHTTLTEFNEEIAGQDGIVRNYEGGLVTVNDDYVPHAKEIEWYGRMLSDPNIILFNRPEIVQ